MRNAVWIIALPVIGGSIKFWDAKTVPVARHARGFPRLVAGMLVLALAAVVFLWLGFSIDYSTTRDIYFPRYERSDIRDRYRSKVAPSRFLPKSQPEQQTLSNWRKCLRYE